MAHISMLDCTRWDGGYCNEWRFGNRNTKTIAASLVEANIDIVELGFLTNRVLIIAPGRSSVEEYAKIEANAKAVDVVTVAINFDYQLLVTDFIFLSNLRRFRELSPEKYEKCIVTSNIPAMGVYLQTSYADLLNATEAVRDNAGMMLIRLLMELGAREILVAGMDGYDTDPARNYADQSMAFYTRRAQMEAMNTGMSTVLKQYSKDISLRFVTEPKFVRVEA